MSWQIKGGEGACNYYINLGAIKLQPPILGKCASIGNACCHIHAWIATPWPVPYVNLYFVGMQVTHSCSSYNI